MRETVRILVPLLLAATVTAQEPPDEGQQTPAKKDVHELAPKLPTSEIAAAAKVARAKGFAFLVETQNADGSWGSHDPLVANLKDFGFQTKNAGSQNAVRMACTAICAHAILETPERTKGMQAALDRGIASLLVPEKFAFHPGESFNTWGYGIKLDFLARLWNAPEGLELRDRIRESAEVCIAGLERYQQHEGGWGYYAGPSNDFESMSFNTGNFLVALKTCADAGIPVKEGMMRDAARILVKMAVPDGSFVYSSGHRKSANSQLMNLGAGSRSIAAALGLYAVDIYDDDDLLKTLDAFHRSENYLEDGRKLIQPHTAVHAISGYFFFYGYNYASEAAAFLGERVELGSWDRYAWTMLRTQEDDGSWWDTAAADYGDKWGTGFAVLTLGRYLDMLEEREIPIATGAGPGEDGQR